MKKTFYGLWPNAINHLEQKIVIRFICIPAFNGSSLCQQTDIPGAPSGRDSVCSPALFHSLHVKSSPVLATWSPLVGSNVTEFTKSVCPSNGWSKNKNSMMFDSFYWTENFSKDSIIQYMYILWGSPGLVELISTPFSVAARDRYYLNP